MAFADLYPYEDFAPIADVSWWRTGDFDHKSGYSSDAYKAASAADTADKKRYGEHKTLFSERVQTQLDALLAEGRLAPISGTGGRSISFAKEWNRYLAGEEGESYERKWMLGEFERILTRHIIRMDEGRYDRRREEGYVPGTHITPTEEQARAAWKGICQDMDSGNSDSIFGWNIEVNDSSTGDRCHIVFADWKPTLLRYNAQHELEEVQDIAPLELVTARFEVPTGKLMLTDALRIKSFNEGTTFDSTREYHELDLGNAAGRTKRISAHAEEHQIGYTQTTNTSVAVYRNPQGRLLVTERWMVDEDGEELPEDNKGNTIVKGWEWVGAFSCDVWAILAFDRQTAIARMSDGGQENAEAELDRYLAMAGTRPAADDHQGHHEACYAGNILQLEVEPGTWTIHAGEDFNKKVDREALGIPEGTEVWCLLSKAA